MSIAIQPEIAMPINKQKKIETLAAAKHRADDENDGSVLKSEDDEFCIIVCIAQKDSDTFLADDNSQVFCEMKAGDIGIVVEASALCEYFGRCELVISSSEGWSFDKTALGPLTGSDYLRSCEDHRIDWCFETRIFPAAKRAPPKGKFAFIANWFRDLYDSAKGNQVHNCAIEIFKTKFSGESVGTFPSLRVRTKGIPSTSVNSREKYWKIDFDSISGNYVRVHDINFRVPISLNRPV